MQFRPFGYHLEGPVQRERCFHPVPLGRLQEDERDAARLSLSADSTCLAPPRVLPGWELQGGLQLPGNNPDSSEQLPGGLLSVLVNKVAVHMQAQGADSCAGLDPPLPQRTRSRLLGKMLLLFQADNRPFPCKSLHAPVQTYPQSISAQQMLRLKGQTQRPALLFAKGKQKLFVPEGGKSQSASALPQGPSDAGTPVSGHLL